MNSLVLIAIGNAIAWAIVIGAMFRLARGESNMKDKLAALEDRMGVKND